MEEKKLSSDAFRWAYDRYIKNDPEMVEFYREIGLKSDIARQIFAIRKKLHMTRDDLAQFSGLTPDVVEDLEESDYDGSWSEAIERINRAFEKWIQDVIIPAARMTRDEYSVKTVSA